MPLVFSMYFLMKRNWGEYFLAAMLMVKLKLCIIQLEECTWLIDYSLSFINSLLKDASFFIKFLIADFIYYTVNHYQLVQYLPNLNYTKLILLHYCLIIMLCETCSAEVCVICRWPLFGLLQTKWAKNSCANWFILLLGYLCTARSQNWQVLRKKT